MDRPRYKIENADEHKIDVRKMELVNGNLVTKEQKLECPVLGCRTLPGLRVSMSIYLFNGSWCFPPRLAIGQAMKGGSMVATKIKTRNILCFYNGGGYDECMWEWNFFSFDKNGNDIEG